MASASGRLWLGINDDHPEDNNGRWTVAVELEDRPVPSKPLKPVVTPGSRLGAPVLARAPDALRAYVVPAASVLEEPKWCLLLSAERLSDHPEARRPGSIDSPPPSR